MDNKKKLIEDKPKAKSKSKSKSKVGSRKKEKDPRISITIGVLFMLIGLFCLLSIISYLIGYKLTGNWGDTLGMYLSEYSFGIGSLYIIFLIMLSGSLLAFKGPKIKLLTLSKYCFVCLIWLPLFLATILPDNKTCEMFYGLIGLELYQLVEPYISNIGIYIILFFTAFLYVIFTFDIKMPTINLRKREDEEDEEEKEKIEGFLR